MGANGTTGLLRSLNSNHHKTAVTIFGLIVLAHWAEHLSQAFQIWVLGWTTADARGVLGLPFPWLISSEWLHYGYAIIMLAGLFLLLPGFTGRSRKWWMLALGIQFWHHIEHLLLLIQAITHTYLAGNAVPASLVQLLVPRVELHLFYNTIVTIPMVVAMVLHRHVNESERRTMVCTCAVPLKPREAAV